MERDEMMHEADHDRSAARPESGEKHDLARPAFPRAAERAGVTTSAMVRDAARLRTVMTHAAERDVPMNVEGVSTDGEEAGASGGFYDRTGRGSGEPAIGIPLPDLAVDHVAGSMSEDYTSRRESRPDHAAVERAGYGATRIVTPRPVRPLSEYSGEHSSRVAAKGESTWLRPVGALGAADEHCAAVASGQRAAAAPGPAYAAAGSHQEDVWEAVATAARPRMASDAWTGASRRRDGGFRKGVAAAVTILAGTTIGIALYAGGGGLLSGIFSNRNEGVQPLSPSAVTERPLPAESAAAVIPGNPAPVAAATDVTSEQGVPSAAAASASDAAATGATESTAPQRQPAAVPTDRVPPATPAAQVPPLAKPRSADVAETAQRTATTEASAKTTAAADKKSGEAKAASRPATEERTAAAPAATEYVVQVRATSDEAEANLIARRLRRKGVTNVQIVRSEKGGAPFFRIRFTASGTAGEVRAKAQSAGYSDVWIVKQK